MNVIACLSFCLDYLGRRFMREYILIRVRHENTGGEFGNRNLDLASSSVEESMAVVRFVDHFWDLGWDGMGEGYRGRGEYKRGLSFLWVLL